MHTMNQNTAKTITILKMPEERKRLKMQLAFQLKWDSLDIISRKHVHLPTQNMLLLCLEFKSIWNAPEIKASTKYHYTQEKSHAIKSSFLGYHNQV